MSKEKKTVELKDEELEKVTGGAEPEHERGCESQTPDLSPVMPGGKNPRLTGPGKQVA